MTRSLIRLGAGVGGGLVLTAAGLLAYRARKERRAEALWRSLASPAAEERFHPDMVEGLPEPARRYLLHAIAPNTPLATSVRLVMHGALRLARDGEPMPMTSEEILAPPRGYVWKARVGQGVVRIRGFDAYADGSGEMCWWLAGLVPIVRASGDNLARSAEGRLIGEAIFIPSVLLPGAGARWEEVSDSTARVYLRSRLEEVALTLEVSSEGELRRLSFPRWNQDPRNGPLGYVEFVSDDFGGVRSFGGYTIPTRFRSGWQLGAKDEFPFFFASIGEAEYW